LNDFPEKQAKIWKNDSLPFEKEIAKDILIASDISKLMSDTETKKQIDTCRDILVY
jgi:hypothetical protein